MIVQSTLRARTLLALVTLMLLFVDHNELKSADVNVTTSVTAFRQLWLVSTRSASSCRPSLAETSRLSFWRSDPDHVWRKESLGQLLATDNASVRTIFYVHENRVSRSDSFRRARLVFTRLSHAVPADRSFRLIAISWPSDRIGIRQRPDTQIKAKRRLTNHDDSDCPTSIWLVINSLLSRCPLGDIY